MIKVIMPCGRITRRESTKYIPMIAVPYSGWFPEHRRGDYLKPTEKYPMGCPCDKATSYDGKMMCEGEYQ